MLGLVDGHAGTGHGTPGHDHPGYPAMATLGTMPAPTGWTMLLHRPGSEQKSAMGSKQALRNSQKALEVNLAETIWLLALF